ncbi:MAG: cytochrome C [Candidatus Angelobacter sp. Gp1-AA117]|nr:MAG: cytochrome C [Candidatus Angelobacter sp. Gp1-AA117]
MKRLYFIVIGFVALLLASCEREQRRFQQGAPSTDTSQSHASMDEIYPGGARPPSNVANVYEENAYMVSEGKRLYEQYNCVGCHFHGGGGIGPPLMDADWIYGGEPQNIHDTIVEGRPNGMPSFRGKIPDQQVWEITAYVRSMSGLLRKDVAPGRSDDMSIKKPEESQKPEPPKK